jgi:hypothetical protein
MKANFGIRFFSCTHYVVRSACLSKLNLKLLFWPFSMCCVNPLGCVNPNFFVIYLFFWVIAKNEEKRECDFFKWLDPKFCVYGKRVVSMLMN